MNALLSRADRRLRESMRKTYKQLRIALEAADANRSGYVSPETLNALINEICMPLTYQDFRCLIQQVSSSVHDYWIDLSNQKLISDLLIYIACNTLHNVGQTRFCK